MNKNKKIEIISILIIAISIFIFVSLVGYKHYEEPTISAKVKIENPMGILGVFIGHYLIKISFGYSVFIAPIFAFYAGWSIFSKKDILILVRSSAYILSLIVILSLSIATINNQFFSLDAEFNTIYSGQMMHLISSMMKDWMGSFGVYILLISGWMTLIRSYLSYDFYEPFKLFYDFFLQKFNKYKKSKEVIIKEEEKRDYTRNLKQKITEPNDMEKESGNDENIDLNKNDTAPSVLHDQNEEESPQAGDVESQILKNDSELSLNKIEKDSDSLNVEEIEKTEEVFIDDLKERKQPKKKYQLPSTELLATPILVSDALSKDELVERATLLTSYLSTFGVEGKVVNVHPGPVITLFEVEPAEGVRVNKFVQLSDDIARVMKAVRVRVIAPIPGKSSVGIEIPNKNPATVYFKSVVNSKEFADANSLLSLAVGKTTTGGISTLDLSKMPHLLIAGTTGSGKSVCINTIICSILYRATPDQVKFVLIDPKKVEMTLYRNLEGYHLLKMEDIQEPIITKSDNAILALRALEKEMDSRYDTLAEVLVRNIGEYNEKMISSNSPIMPYIVLVIDELADLMMLSKSEVEAPIARLAQLARAVGIHLVVATQRPSVDVITGVIRSNFPSRIAFQVPTKIDSRTILDQSGAENLIGRGDLLHIGSGSSELTRMHNAFLSLEEIESIMNHIIKQDKPDEMILPSVRDSSNSDFSSDNEDNDELFEDAIKLVITHQQGSISLLQRRLKIGYSRAARLIDEMEASKIVGPFTGSKAREVLVDETYLEVIKDY